MNDKMEETYFKEKAMGSCLAIFLIIAAIAAMVIYWPVTLLIVIVCIIIYQIAKKNNKEKLEQKFVNETRNYDSMEGHQFEYFCADVLRRNGFQNVSVTPGSGDYGVDIIAFKDGRKYVVQCKCYSQNVSNKAVQEVYSGKSFYDADVAIVLTNRYFTQSAVDTAYKNGVILWNRDKLNSLIRDANTTK